jgi:hypothetical protein
MRSIAIIAAFLRCSRISGGQAQRSSRQLDRSGASLASGADKGGGLVAAFFYPFVYPFALSAGGDKTTKYSSRVTCFPHT